VTNQPKWKQIAQLGDTNPFDYGGYYIFKDETGVYPEEAELLELDDPDDEESTYTIYRFILEKCTFINGILSDNSSHPEHPAWFAHPESEREKRPQDTTYLSRVAGCMGMPVQELQRLFCSDDPKDRAFAYREVGTYHGLENLDSYPLTKLTRAEVEERYQEEARYGPDRESEGAD
jgi:hypothetical protein